MSQERATAVAEPLSGGKQKAAAIPIVEEPPVAQIELRRSTLPAQLEPSLTPEEQPKPTKSGLGGYWLFTVIVVPPIALASVYLFAIAAPRYVSSASFIVREASQARPDAVAVLVQKAGSAIATEETYAVGAYLTSRDMVDLLAKTDNLRAVLNRPVGDFLFRYPTFWLPNDDEFLYRRFQWMTNVNVDLVTNIVTVEVNAFDARDAQAILRAMLSHAEALVNRLNTRAYQDELATADAFVLEAQKKVDDAEAQLQAFRNASGSVDPSAESEAKLKVIAGLSTQLALIEAQIKEQTAQAPNAPGLPTLRQQADAYREEIRKRRLEIAGSTGSDATKLETYEQLKLKRDLAAKSLAAASSDLDAARQDARQQHLYIQLITEPNLSLDFAQYPRTTLDWFATLALCLLTFQTLRKLRHIAKEHRP